jgi:protein-S-isoprenylcysteine O-methyltransferase Ste14
MVSRASRNVAAGIFATGLMLVGFGLMIYLLPRLFATVAAVIFFIGGAGCISTAVKIFLAQRQLEKNGSDDSTAYRENVRIHIEEGHDR